MHEKKKSHIDREEWIHNSQDDISDALYLAIKSHDLPYDKATLSRVTRLNIDTGNVLLQHFLDYDTPNKKQLTHVVFVFDGDDEVTVDRIHVQYIKGKVRVDGVATV